MTTFYKRPETLDEALILLSDPESIPLAGGTWVNSPEFKETRGADKSITFVDLQRLGLNHIRKHGNSLEIGACATLEQLRENQHISAALTRAIKLEAPLNIRNAATIAGTLVTCGGRSAFAVAMLALDAKLTSVPDDAQISLGNYLPRRVGADRRGLITTITIPLNVRLTFDSISRSPSDLPIVCTAVAEWDSGRIRLALGGYGKSPTLAMDGTSSDDIKAAARNAYHEAGDQWASAEYRSEMAAILAERCLGSITG